MAFGWFFVPVMLFVIVCGSYILPVVLVGIVSISFNEATYRAEQLQEMYSGMQEVIDKARKELPDFFDPEVLNGDRFECRMKLRVGLSFEYSCINTRCFTTMIQDMLQASRCILGQSFLSFSFSLAFFCQRMQAIRAVFDEMDADGLMVLDVHEMNLFYRYCFQSLFDVELSADEVTGLFHLMVSFCDAQLLLSIL